MKNTTLASILVFNFIFSLSAMEQTNIKKDYETALVILKHYRLVIKCEFRKLKNNEFSEDIALEQVYGLKKTTREMIQNLRKTSDVYSLFPEFYYAYAYLTDERVKSGKVSNQTLDKFHNNLGQLALINIRNENAKKTSSLTLLQPSTSETDDEKIKTPSQYKSDYESAVEALMKKYHLSNEQK